MIALAERQRRRTNLDVEYLELLGERIRREYVLPIFILAIGLVAMLDKAIELLGV